MNNEMLEKYREQMEESKKAQKTCPNYGYCPYCGRGGWHMVPYVPYMPYYPSQPWYPVNPWYTVTC